MTEDGGGGRRGRERHGKGAPDCLKWRRVDECYVIHFSFWGEGGGKSSKRLHYHSEFKA